MNCTRFQDAFADVLAGHDPAVPAEELRTHMATCAHCQAEAPAIARRIAVLNATFQPPIAGLLSPDALQRLLALPGAGDFPALRVALQGWRASHARLAAADATPAPKAQPLVHRLEVIGANLKLFIHMKEPGLARISVVDATSMETSQGLDGSRVRFSSGRSCDIRGGGAEVPLNDLIEEIGFSIVRPDGVELRVREP